MLAFSFWGRFLCFQQCSHCIPCSLLLPPPYPYVFLFVSPTLLLVSFYLSLLIGYFPSVTKWILSQKIGLLSPNPFSPSSAISFLKVLESARDLEERVLSPYSVLLLPCFFLLWWFTWHRSLSLSSPSVFPNSSSFPPPLSLSPYELASPSPRMIWPWESSSFKSEFRQRTTQKWEGRKEGRFLRMSLDISKGDLSNLIPLEGWQWIIWDKELW